MPQNNEVAELVADIREQILYFQELGVKTLSFDLSTFEASVALSATADVTREREPAALHTPIQPPQPKRPGRPAGSRLASLPSLKDLAPSISERPAPSKIEIVSEREDLVETIAEIRAEIGPACTRCKLSQLGRSKVVNSVGNFNADLMFVGEAPGADEDEQGEPFVGRAGQLLSKIIEGIGLKREDVFIGNINRCRPPKNRAPEPDESSVCKPFLLREIAVVRPKVIVVLGATAAQNLLETKVPIGRLRGHFHDYRGTKVMPTFHPAYLLRDPNKKREVWEDMKLVREYLKTCS